jgi:TolA-binding protein
MKVPNGLKDLLYNQDNQLINFIKIIKKYWKEILLVLLLVGLVLKSKHEANQMRLAHEVVEQALQNEINNLKQIHSREIEQREVALEEYKERIKILEEDYNEAQEEIARLREKQKEEFVIDFSQDKDALAQAIIARYGFTYVP